MLPNFLFPDQTVSNHGEGPVVPVEDAAGKPLQVTLGISKIKEQQSLDVQIFGSSDGNTWSGKPTVFFPQKFYTGVSSIVLDLSTNPEIRYLRIKYKTNRWGHWKDAPAFTFYVFAEPMSGFATQGG